jgi:hypothetical protein
LLTGSIQGTKNNVKIFLENFSTYSWLWVKRPEDALKAFMKDNPTLEQYEEELKKFDSYLKSIQTIDETH